MAKKVLLRRPSPDSPVTISSPGTITLTKNMVFSDSGYAIDNAKTWDPGDQVIIDLNGFSIRYGAGVRTHDDVWTYNSVQSGNVGHMAIASPDRPDRNKDFGAAGVAFNWNPDTRQMPSVIIRNGTIKTGSGSGLAYCLDIDVSGLDDVTIHDITFETAADDTMSIRTGPGSVVYDCTFDVAGGYDSDHSSIQQPNDVFITNRSQLPATIIALDGAVVRHNTFNNFLASGVRCFQNVTVHNNTMDGDNRVTNNYAINFYGVTGGEAYSNTLTITNARGIAVANNGEAYIHDNTLDVTQADQTAAHGIKLEEQDGSVVENNTVICRTDEVLWGVYGRATPLNIQSDPSKVGIVRNNSFRAIVNGAANIWAYPLYFPGVTSEKCDSLTIEDCTFRTNDRCVGFQSLTPGAQELYVRGCTFDSTDNANGVFCAGFFQELVSDIHFVDCTYLSCDVRNSAGSQSDVTYQIDWTITLNGSPGAAFTAVDANTDTVWSGNLDGSGVASEELPEVVVHRKTDNTTDVDERSPYTITVGGVPKSVDVDSAKTVVW